MSRKPAGALNIASYEADIKKQGNDVSFVTTAGKIY